MKSKDALRWAAAAATYFLLQVVSLHLYNDRPALRGPAVAGVCLLLLLPHRHWTVLGPLMFLGAAVARLWYDAPEPILVAACNVLEVLAVAAVLHGWHGLQTPWYARAQLLRLLLAAGVLPLFTGALAAATGTGGDTFVGRWLSWYMASALAYMTMMPFCLGWVQRQLAGRDSQWLEPRKLAGILALAALGVVVMRQEVFQPLLALTFPLAILVVWRYRLGGATLFVALLAVFGGFFAEQQVGALFGRNASLPLPARLLVLQMYLGIIFLCSLPIAVLLAEQELLLDELRRKSDARAEFLAAMSHEIRTPMTGVLGMADMLAAQPLTPEQRRYVDAMRTSGRHLVSVVNDILDFSRIETGRLTMERIDFHLSEVVEQVRSLLHPIALEKGLTFTVSVAPELPPVLQGDPTRLRQILLNLCGNAVKFTAHGSVRLEVDAQPGDGRHPRYRFAVHDTGIGIAERQLAQLFTPFTQADQSTARMYGGSGLGLAISARLAQAMNGRIDVQSTVGEGSVFTLEVPLAAGDPGHRAAVGTQALATPQPQRILVAEDVPINRDILRMALEAHGHAVVFAHDGAQAVDLVRTQDFDLVLMDVQMPVMDGVEATRRIRALPGARGLLPIIGLSANVMSQEQARYLQAGMDQCLTKPIEWDRLADAIARLSQGAVGAASQEAVAPLAGQAAAILQPPVAATSSPVPAAPLFDAQQMQSMRDMAGSEPQFRHLLQTCMTSVDETLADLLAAEASAVAAIAHRLRGSAGLLGLARVSTLAGALEHAGDAEVESLRQQLVAAHQETRAALLETGQLQG